MSLINDLLLKGGNYAETKDDYMNKIERIDAKQFYELLKNDKLSKAKCADHIDATKLCLEFQANQPEKCVDFKKAWLVCLKG